MIFNYIVLLDFCYLYLFVVLIETYKFSKKKFQLLIDFVVHKMFILLRWPQLEKGEEKWLGKNVLQAD